jgi:hypothetical protein
LYHNERGYEINIDELIKKIYSDIFKVNKVLGAGFMEKVQPVK